MFMMVDNVRVMTVKKSCKHGENGLFEHLLFLLHYISDTPDTVNSYIQIFNFSDRM